MLQGRSIGDYLIHKLLLAAVGLFAPILLALGLAGLLPGGGGAPVLLGLVLGAGFRARPVDLVSTDSVTEHDASGSAIHDSSSRAAILPLSKADGIVLTTAGAISP